MAFGTGWAFWVTAGALALGVALILLRALRQPTEGSQAEAADLRVYRDQLSEVDRDLARGTLNAPEAQRVRAEVARRMLEADRAQAETGDDNASTASRALAPALVVAGAMLGAVAVYAAIGLPGYPDLPLQARLAEADARMASRPSQAEAVAKAPAAPPRPAPDAAFADLMSRLREAVATRPDDLRGLDLLARNEASLGNFAAAEAAMTQLIRVKGAAVRAEDHAGLAEIQINAAGGYISPEAEANLVRALQTDPENAAARYFSGLMFAQGGRFDRTFALWRRLLEEGPPDAPWVGTIRAQIADVAFRAGVDYTPPPPLAGPSDTDVAAAASQTPEERAAMIEGMVAQLSDRLASEGGSVEEWGQLIRALGVLGRTDQAATIHTEAQVRFAGQASALSFLKEAAVAAGLTP